MRHVRFHLYIQRMSRSMIKQQNSGATAHVVLYTPRQSKIDTSSLSIHDRGRSSSLGMHDRGRSTSLGMHEGTLIN